MTTALSHLHHICEDAMAQYAIGAKEANTLHWVGMGEDEELPHITATGAKTVKIIKPKHHRLLPKEWQRTRRATLEHS